MADPTDSLRTYMPRVLWVECLRCKRRGEMKADKMRSRYGDITLGELAQRVAAHGGCALAGGDEARCDVQVVEPPIEIWGRLRDAESADCVPFWSVSAAITRSSVCSPVRPWKWVCQPSSACWGLTIRLIASPQRSGARTVKPKAQKSSGTSGTIHLIPAVHLRSSLNRHFGAARLGQRD